MTNLMIGLGVGFLSCAALAIMWRMAVHALAQLSDEPDARPDRELEKCPPGD